MVVHATEQDVTGRQVCIRTRQKTLRSTIARTLAKAILAGFGVALFSLALESAMLPGQMWFAQTGGQPSGPVEVDPAAVLVAENGCWVGSPPIDQVGKVPGHVVVVTEAGEARYGGRRLVHRALQQTFDGVDHGLTVYGFCR